MVFLHSSYAAQFDPTDDSQASLDYQSGLMGLGATQAIANIYDWKVNDTTIKRQHRQNDYIQMQNDCVEAAGGAFYMSVPGVPSSHCPSTVPGNVCSVSFETVSYVECCVCIKRGEWGCFG